jgi:hypothetical protein
MGLKRFESIHKLFTASSNSVFDPLKDPPLAKHKPTSRRKPKGAPLNSPPNTAGALLNESDEFFEAPSVPSVGQWGHWQKIEPLANHIRETCQRVYTPGTHTTIDEIMLAFRGRSKDTTKLPNKPISKGFKNWVLAEHRYVWNWL